MTILIFGRTGQVATELGALVGRDGAVLLGREEADLSRPEECAAAIRAHRPSAVINAAAYTAVDRAEEEEALATLVNGDAPGVMARECALLGIPLVHISTDYVFDGGGDAPFGTDAPIGPLGAYGRSKAKGEALIRAADGVHAILRTSWVFSAHGGNFVKTMLRLSETRDALNVVEDQIGGPTPAEAIARACLTIAETLRSEPEKTGTYHFAGAPDVSWKTFAEAIFEVAGRDVAVTGIPATDYPTPAARPANSRMDCTATTRAFGIDRPDWRAAVERIAG